MIHIYCCFELLRSTGLFPLLHLFLIFLIFWFNTYIFYSHGRKVENVLPDNLFASPTKSSVNQHPEFSPDLAEVKESTDFCVTSSSSENNASVPTFSTSDVASH